jgi:hypothetical protein
MISLFFSEKINDKPLDDLFQRLRPGREKNCKDIGKCKSLPQPLLMA